MEIVREIMSHPAIWPHIHEDTITECNPIDHDGFHWMLALDAEGPCGVFLVHAINSVCYQMHTCLLPRIWGAEATKAAQELLKWAFIDTRCKKMTTAVPEYNRLALRFAKKGGMIQEGINMKSFLYNGVLINQIMLGITKEEWLCQQLSP
jgi:RimJ/RimL family protein N-acetyltransferase